jgi:ABC-type Mn2+/Zn2+ transport system ATPase subunit
VTGPAFVLKARRLRAARGVTVATDVALTASPGEVIAVEGPNGAGKTTLLAAAAGLLPAGNPQARPTSVGYAPERASVLPRIPVSRWLVGLARTAGLSRSESVLRASDVLGRLGLADAAGRPVNVLSRGNTQRALVAQALVGDPGLLILDEPSGGMDDDGVSRVAAEIERAARRAAVVLVARHPTAPLPLPAGTTWRLQAGAITAAPRDVAPAVPYLLVETGDGAVRHVTRSALPAVLRAALDANLAIRRVQPAPAAPHPGPGPGRSPGPGPGRSPGVSPGVSVSVPAAPSSPSAHADGARDPVRRSSALSRVLYGAAHRARLLAVSQWFFAPMLVFLAVLAIIYATDAGAPLQAAAVTAVALIPVMTWMAVLAQRVDGRELARAFAAHVGGRGRAHLATDIGLAPYAAALIVAAIIWPLASQGEWQHPRDLVLRMIGLHLAAALLGIGIGSLVVLVERVGWRMTTAIAVFLGLVVLKPTPMTPLLRLSTATTTVLTPVGTQAAWLALPGVALVAVAACLSTRVY